LVVSNADGSEIRNTGIRQADSACVFPDGKRVAFLRSKPGNDNVRAIFVARLFARGLKRITSWEGIADKIDCSPDGSRIVFSTPEFGPPRSSNLFTVRTNGTHLVQLTRDKGGTINDGADSWSPDGKKIAFVSNRDGTYQIYSVSADGTGVTQITRGPEAHSASWGSHP
jgi:Tol biopolymer transport system component